MLFSPATKVFPLQVCIIYAAYQYVASQSSNFVNILVAQLRPLGWQVGWISLPYSVNFKYFWAWIDIETL